MLHREAELGVEDAGALAGLAVPRDDEAAVDLRAVVHPRRILLADVAALGEADPVELGGVAFEPQRFVRAELGAALGDSEREAVGEPAFRWFPGRCEPAVAEVG